MAKENTPDYNNEQEEYIEDPVAFSPSPDFNFKNISIVLACSAAGFVGGYVLGEMALPQTVSALGPKALIMGAGVSTGWAVGLTVTTGTRWLRGY